MADYDLDAILADMDRAADRAEKALAGKYGEFYKQLRALSPEEIETITPGITDQVVYEKLMALVQQATQQNLDQAALVERVKALGDTAIAIAKKTASFAKYMV